MKKLLFFIFIPSMVYANGPLFQHKDTFSQQEFENIYKDLRSKASNGTSTSTLTIPILVPLGTVMTSSTEPSHTWMIDQWNHSYGNNISLYFGFDAGANAVSSLAAHALGLGAGSLQYNQGLYNTCGGDFTCSGNPVTGFENSAWGYEAGLVLTTSFSNTLIGAYSGLALTGGNQNTCLGEGTCESAIDTVNDVAVGFTALQSRLHGTGDTALGYQDLNSAVNNGPNTAGGYNSQTFNQGGSSCTTFGWNTGKQNVNLSDESHFGHGASSNVVSGAGGDSSFGSKIFPVMTKGPNTGFGAFVGTGLIDGTGNLFLGRNTGSGIVHSNNNTFVGDSVSATSDVTNSIGFGANVSITASSQCVIGGVPGSSTAVSIVVGGIQGSTQSVLAGNVGEFVQSQATSLVSQSGSTNYDNVASISLSTGAWTLSGSIETSLNGATITRSLCALSINSGNTTTDHIGGYNELTGFLATTNSVGSCVIPNYHLILNAATTAYLKSRQDYSVANPQFKGTLQALRDPH